jgi:hypothetical protein
VLLAELAVGPEIKISGCPLRSINRYLVHPFLKMPVFD